MKTLLLVRPVNRLADDVAICQQFGIHGVPFSPIAIEPIAHHLSEQLANCHVIFWVSPTAIELGINSLSECHKSDLIHLAVGASSAKLLQQHGIAPIFPTHGNDSEAVLSLPIWQQLPPHSHILIVRGENGRDFLAQQLSAQNFIVHHATVYRRVVQTLDWTALDNHFPDAVWVTSSQLAQELFKQVAPKFTQKLQSLIYLSHHERIKATLNNLGAKQVFCFPNLTSALQHGVI